MDLLSFCATQFEAGAYVLPGEKHALVRSIVYALCLLDDGERDVRMALKRRKVNIDRFIKIMRVRSFVSSGFLSFSFSFIVFVSWYVPAAVSIPARVWRYDNACGPCAVGTSTL